MPLRAKPADDLGEVERAKQPTYTDVRTQDLDHERGLRPEREALVELAGECLRVVGGLESHGLGPVRRHGRPQPGVLRFLATPFARASRESEASTSVLRLTDPLEQPARQEIGAERDDVR